TWSCSADQSRGASMLPVNLARDSQKVVSVPDRGGPSSLDGSPKDVLRAAASWLASVSSSVSEYPSRPLFAFPCPSRGSTTSLTHARNVRAHWVSSWVSSSWAKRAISSIEIQGKASLLGISR